MYFDATQPQYAQNPTPIDFLQEVDGSPTQMTQQMHENGRLFEPLNTAESKRRRLMQNLKESEMEQRHNDESNKAGHNVSTSTASREGGIPAADYNEETSKYATVAFDPERHLPFQWFCLTVEKQPFWMNLATALRVLDGTLLGKALQDDVSNEEHGIFLLDPSVHMSQRETTANRKRKSDIYMYLPDRDPSIWHIVWGFFKSGELHAATSMNARLVDALKKEADDFHIHSLSKFLQEKALDWREYIVRNARATDIRIRGMTLFSVNLEPLNLVSIDFSLCKFYKCNLNGTDLSNAIFNGAKLVDTQLDSSKAHNLSMCPITAQNCSFDRIVFEKSLVSGTIQNSRFSKALLKQSAWNNLELHDITFHVCGFSSMTFGAMQRSKQLCTYLRNCSFDRCTFTSSDLSFLRFSTTCTFNRCVFDSCNMREAQDRGIIPCWSSVHLKKCQFKKCTLNEMNFSEATIEQCSFTECELKDCNFTKARLNSIKMQDSMLQESKFAQSSLQFADFCRVELSSTNFSSADLTGATFDTCDLSLSDFSMSVTRGTRVEKCQTNGTINLEPLKNSDSTSFKTPKKAHHQKKSKPSPKMYHVGSPGRERQEDATEMHNLLTIHTHFQT